MKSFLYLFLLLASFSLDGGQINSYFSPQDAVADKLIERIEKEKKSIYVAIYSLTHRGIAKALLEAKKRGAHVEVIIDPFSLKNSKAASFLVKEGVPVFVWTTNEKKKPIMHDKFCVFGSDSVWTGSFNFTYKANTSNQENALLVQDEALAKSYLNHFHQIKGSCKQL